MGARRIPWALRAALAASISLAGVSCCGRVVSGGVPAAPLEVAEAVGRGWSLPVPRPLPDLLGDSDAPDAEGGGVGFGTFSPGIGLRVGLASYPNATEHEVASPRNLFGVYWHFAETETKRLQGEAAYLQSSLDPETAGEPGPWENRYVTVGLSYVKYLGRAGLVSMSTGGGVIIEDWYGDQAALGYLDASLGYWISLGQKGLDVRVGCQVPIGRDPNVPLVVLVSVSYDM